MGVIKVDENDPVGELEPSFPFRDVKIMHNVDVRDYYDLKEEIGRGKFGTVYRCIEKKSNIVLAAKFVPIAKKQDRINVEREVEIMRTLQHPRLIQIYDSFEIHNVMCVVLELIEGGELFERVIDDDFILTEKACAVFMRQICEGVSFIHLNKIIHLDLKPENILCLTKTGNRIKIIDFGLARKYDPNKKLQVLFGTPEFVAPEVVNFDEITTATDMWSVGVICYVLLSGLSPFMGENDLQTMTNVTMAQYDFDDEAFDSISADAKDFISSLLKKNKEERLSAGDCANHPWLKRKPPPPTYLEQSKENLKSYVDAIHLPSPFLLNDSISNGAGNIDLIPQVPELSKRRTAAETIDKSKPIIVPDQKNSFLGEQNLKLKNEINLEKSAITNLVSNKELPAKCNVTTPLPPSHDAKDIKNEEKENLRRKVIKTDSFNELPRKYSITVSDGSRELPRRSSLTRADKAKNEIKRETFVTFVGPREIKPIDPISLEVKTAVEELTTFIKSTLEDQLPPTKRNDVKNSNNSSVVRKCSDRKCLDDEVFIEEESHTQASEFHNITPILETSNNESINNKHNESIQVSSANYLNLQSSRESYDQLKSKGESATLLRPAEYLKLTNKPKEMSHTDSIYQPISSLLSTKTPNFKSTTTSLMNTNSFETVDKNLVHSTRTNNKLHAISSTDSTKLADTVDKKCGHIRSSNIITQMFKTVDSTKNGDTTIPGPSDKKGNNAYSSQNMISSTKEMSYLKQSQLSSAKDIKPVVGTSTRNQGIGVISVKKLSDSSDTVNNSDAIKSNENINIFKFYHSTALRNDSTIPKKSQSIKKENTNSSKENNNSSSTYGESNKKRASSLDPTSAAYSSVGSYDQPFQSRFLRSSQLKLESTFRCSSEIASSKYEDFRSRYSNYKELAMDNDKFIRKSLVFDRKTPSKSSEKNEETQTSRANANENHPQCSTTKQTISVPQTTTLSNYSLRQKFSLTDQQKNVDVASKLDGYRSSRIESTLNSYRTEKEKYNTGISMVNESISLRQSQTSSQKSQPKSKVSIPEKCPSSPQKSL